MKTKKAPSQRNLVVGGVAGAGLLVALSWFFLIHPEMSSTNSLRSQTSDVELQNSLLMNKVSDLKKQNDQLDTLNKTLAEKIKELPSEPGVQDYTQQLVAQTGLNHVSLTGIVAGAPTLAGVPVAGAVASGVNPAGKLFAIPLSVTTEGSLNQQRALLATLQKVGPRRALVTSVEFSPKSGASAKASSNIDTSDQMSLQITIFVAPQTPAEEKALEQEIGAK